MDQNSKGPGTMNSKVSPLYALATYHANSFPESAIVTSYFCTYLDKIYSYKNM